MNLPRRLEPHLCRTLRNFHRIQTFSLSLFARAAFILHQTVLSVIFAMGSFFLLLLLFPLPRLLFFLTLFFHDCVHQLYVLTGLFRAVSHAHCSLAKIDSLTIAINSNGESTGRIDDDDDYRRANGHGQHARRVPRERWTQCRVGFRYHRIECGPSRGYCKSRSTRNRHRNGQGFSFDEKDEYLFPLKSLVSSVRRHVLFLIQRQREGEKERETLFIARTARNYSRGEGS